MQFEETVHLRVALAKAIESQRPQTLANELANCHSVFETLLINYHFAERGSVHGVQLVPTSITFVTAQQIELILRYKTQHRYACDGIIHDFDKSMKISLFANPETKSIKLVGEYWPERDGEEF